MIHNTNPSRAIRARPPHLRGLLCCVALAGATVGPRARAQEISLLAGTITEKDVQEESYTWEIEYLHGLGQHFAASFSWINEGHVPAHHRDGHSVRIWARTELFDDRLSLLAGLGTYRFFDTNAAANADGFADDHGWGGVASLGARWYARGGWFGQVRATLIDTRHHFDTRSVTIGVGYQLEHPRARGPVFAPVHQTQNTTRHEVSVLLGQTIVNSLDSQSGLSGCVEYRQGLGPHLDWTASWIYEGDVELIRRNGLASQLWLTRSILDDRLALAVGGGYYLSVDRFRDAPQGEADQRELAGLVTMSAAFRFTPDYFLRVSWNRVVSDYDRDTDVMLIGLGRSY